MARLMLIAESQLGLFTARQALDQGFSRKQIDGRLAAGLWVVARRGVYRVAGYPVSWQQGVLAVCLSGGEGVVASHRTAAQIWKLWGVADPGVIEVTSYRTQAPKGAGVFGHRTSCFHPTDVTVHLAIPVTTVARTIIDLAGWVSDYVLERVVDDALRRRLITLEQVRAAFEWIPPYGRRKILPIRKILADRLPGYSPGDSHLEAWALGVLERAGLPKPMVGIEVGDYFIDAGWPEVKVGLEGLGFDPHGLRHQFDKDAVRETWLTVVAGWDLIEVTSNTSEAWLVEIATHALRDLIVCPTPP